MKDNELYLFYELQHWDDPGCIAMIKTKDLKVWSKPQMVLKEPFHLSFPFVFEDQGVIYMIPESQEDDSIRLYCANDDLRPPLPEPSFLLLFLIIGLFSEFHPS